MGLAASAAIRELRRRIGETEEGSWTDSELRDILSRAQEKLCDDAVTASGHALIVDVKEYRSTSGKYKYQLPEETNEVLAVFHRSGGAMRQLPQAPQSEFFLDGFNVNSRATVPTGWQFYPNAYYLITEGIATQRSTTSLVDSDRATNLTYSFLSGESAVDAAGGVIGADDFVLNVTDGSFGDVASVTNGATLALDTQTEEGGLSGGERNIVQHGDHYQVYQREASHKYLWVSPPLANNETETIITVSSGTTDSTLDVGNVSGDQQRVSETFSYKQDRVIHGVWLYYSSETGDAQGNVVVRVEQTTGSVSNGDLVDFRAKATRKISDLTTGSWEYWTFVAPVRISANTLYGIVVEISPQSDYFSSPSGNYLSFKTSTAAYSDGAAYTKTTSTWSSASTDLLFKLDAVTGSPSIFVSYSKYPAPLNAASDLVEIPRWGYEAMYLYSIFLAMQKVHQMRSPEVREAYVLYQNEVERVRARIVSQSKSGYSTVTDVTTAYGLRGVSRSADPRLYDLPLTFRSS